MPKVDLKNPNEVKKLLEKIAPTPDQWAEADKAVSILVFLNGTLEGNKPFWAYLAVPPSKMEDFRVAQKKGGYDMRDYGRIIEMGEGKEPPAEVVKKIKDEYGDDPDFEKTLLETFQEEMTKFLKQNKDSNA